MRNPFRRRRLGRHRAERRIFDPSNWTLPSPVEGAAGSFASVVAELRAVESAMRDVAIWSATDLIASVASQLPLNTYQETPGERPRQVPNPRLVEDPAGDGQGAPDWIYQYLISKLLRGNAYGRIGDGGDRQPIVVLFHPDTVQGWRDRYSGETTWRVDGQRVDFGVWHRRSYPIPGCLIGMSPIERHAVSIGQGMAAARFGLQWFTDGAHPSSILRNTEDEISGPQATEVKARFLATVYGRREPLVLGRGWEHLPIQVKPDESQFLDTQRFSAAQCCRIYGPNVAEILGYETGGSMTYENVEQRSIDFLKFTLNRWLRDIERSLSILLPAGQCVKFNRAALLETDLLSRYRAHATGIAYQFLAADEARAIEDMPPLTPEQKADLAAINAKPPKGTVQEA